MSAPWSRLGRWIAGCGLPLLLLWIAWTQAAPAAGLRLIARAGSPVALALVPFALTLLLDALGWRTLLARGQRRRVSLRELFLARACGEAVSQSLPSAGVAGEAASAWLLSRRSGMPLGEALGSLAARRLLLIPGHALVLALAALATASHARLPWPLAAASALGTLSLLLAALAAARVVKRASPFARLHVSLRRSASPRLREWVGGPSVRLRDADREAARVLALPRSRRLAACAWFFLVYLAESLETLALLRLLGAEVSPWQVLAFEPLVSLLRAVAFFVPAGLGVQDLGYVTLLRLVGVPQAAAYGAAFVALKRLKELAWIAGGWAALLSAQSSPAEKEALGERTATDPLHLRIPQPDHADAPDRARAAGA